jgi:hypothetical protein
MLITSIARHDRSSSNSFLSSIHLPDAPIAVADSPYAYISRIYPH